MKLLALTAVLSGLTGTSAWAESSPDWTATKAKCLAEIGTFEMDPPRTDEQGEKRCQMAISFGRKSSEKYKIQFYKPPKEVTVADTCYASYVFLRASYQNYSNLSSLCDSLDQVRTGDPQKDMKNVLDAAKTQVTDLLTKMSSDRVRARQLRQDNRSLAWQTSERFRSILNDPKSANANDPFAKGYSATDPAADDFLIEMKRTYAMSLATLKKGLKVSEIPTKEKKVELISEAQMVPKRTKEIGEYLTANYELLRFERQVDVQVAKLESVAHSLNINAAQVVANAEAMTTAGLGTPGNPTGTGTGTNTDTRTSADPPPPGSSGSSWLSTAALFAGPAMLAGVNLMNYQNAKKASQGNTSSSLRTEQFALSGPKNPPSASLRSGTTGGPPGDAGTSAASKTKEGEETRFESSSEFSRFTSSGEPGDTDARLPRQFSGALRTSPIFGSPSTAGAAQAGLEAGKSDPGNLDEIFEPQPKAADNNVFNTSGGSGLLKFGGGTSAGGDDSSLKDLFKANPFPDMSGGGPPPAGGGNNLFFRDQPGDRAPASSVQGSEIPGLSDDRSLFVRVKQFHERCQKKGYVTNEGGGKI